MVPPGFKGFLSDEWSKTTIEMLATHTHQNAVSEFPFYTNGLVPSSCSDLIYLRGFTFLDDLLVT
jgi:hypothetical protein